jgi:hypothetical protein
MRRVGLVTAGRLARCLVFAMIQKRVGVWSETSQNMLQLSAPPYIPKLEGFIAVLLFAKYGVKSPVVDDKVPFAKGEFSLG